MDDGADPDPQLPRLLRRSSGASTRSTAGGSRCPTGSRCAGSPTRRWRSLAVLVRPGLPLVGAAAGRAASGAAAGDPAGRRRLRRLSAAGRRAPGARGGAGVARLSGAPRRVAAFRAVAAAGAGDAGRRRDRARRARRRYRPGVVRGPAEVVLRYPATASRAGGRSRLAPAGGRGDVAGQADRARRAAAAGGAVRQPITFAHRNLVFGADLDDVWALYRLETRSYAGLTRSEKGELLSQLAAFAYTVEADFSLLRVTRPWSVAGYRAGCRGDGRLAPRPPRAARRLPRRPRRGAGRPARRSGPRSTSRSGCAPSATEPALSVAGVRRWLGLSRRARDLRGARSTPCWPRRPRPRRGCPTSSTASPRPATSCSG